jgi:endonuclease/exonuclease/phosphatase family metal-dependent hydrolase
LDNLFEDLVILQINIRSIWTNLTEFKQLLDTTRADIVLLQEVKLKTDGTIPKFKGYALHWRTTKEGHRGVGILIKKNLTHEIINLPKTEKIEEISIKLKLKNKELICTSLYIPHETTAAKLKKELQKIVTVAEKYRFILIGGDFNAHNNWWGSGKIDNKGRIVANILGASTLGLCNNGEATRITRPEEIKSAIDLTITSTALLSKTYWEVLNTTIGSDHKPILIKIKETKEKQPTPTKKLINKKIFITELNKLVKENTNSPEELARKIEKIKKKSAYNVKHKERKI